MTERRAPRLKNAMPKRKRGPYKPKSVALNTY
jgi:hypothetical protein